MTLEWWQSDPWRLLLEEKGLIEQFPSFIVARRGATVVCVGQIRVSPPELVFESRLEIHFSKVHPARQPSASLLDLNVPPDRRGSHHWHTFLNGRPCYAEPAHWSPQTLVPEVIGKVEDWLFNYVLLDAGRISRFPEKGRAEIG